MREDKARRPAFPFSSLSGNERLLARRWRMAFSISSGAMAASWSVSLAFLQA